jgi:hypothetical protein
MLIAVAAIFLVIGFLVITQIKPSESGNVAKTVVEVAPTIPSSFSSSAFQSLTDPLQTRNFAVPIDLKNGLGNPKPLGAF